MLAPPFQIRPARSADDLAATATLFAAYADALGIDLAYQGFAAELAALPGRYAPPAGRLLMARDAGNAPIGCVGLRSLAPAGFCELKRLYVAPPGRGLGLGAALVDAVVAEAMAIGYREIRLDTLRDMAAAQALYRKAGFAPIAPYYETPIPGTVFMGRRLVP